MSAFASIFSLRGFVVASALLGLLALGACAGSPPPSTQIKPVSFTAKPPIKLDVAQISIQNSYTPPSSTDHLISCC